VTPERPTTSSAAAVDAPNLQIFVFALFFIFGGITSLNDVILPKLKELFTLNYTQAMLIQFCFFTAYLVIGIPGAQLVKRIGYMRGAAAGLLTMMTGCLLFIPASETATYGLFLLALFVLASGVVIVQVVSNPLISLLGPQRTVHSRLTFAQAFNSLGTTIFPRVGSGLILGGLAAVSAVQLSGPALDAYRTAETQTIVHTYLGLAGALAVIALVVWLFRNRLKGESHEQSSALAGFALLRRPRFGYGALCIFLYVGAEVSIGSLIVNYLRQAHVMGLSEQAAGNMIMYYWGVACGAIVLLGVSTHTVGTVSGYALLAVGLMNSIMFPTVFSLACEKLGARAADGSGIINIAIFGGAVVPLLTGMLADASGSLAVALALPAVCYAIIAGFGIYARRPSPDLIEAPVQVVP
jgi:FHS family L-fucose permease-like MFS transporter